MAVALTMKMTNPGGKNSKVRIDILCSTVPEDCIPKNSVNKYSTVVIVVMIFLTNIRAF